jgi:membrane protease YdiL (CAAX protease family)
MTHVHERQDRWPRPRASRPGSAVTSSSREGRLWRVVTVLEVAAAAVTVLADLLIPSLVLLALAGVSLLARRQPPASLGFHRPARPGRLIGLMLAVAAGWTVFHYALLIPVTNHLSGERQDVSDFERLQGNLGLLLLMLVLAWTLAAMVEETAFRGYLLARLRALLGDGRTGLVVAVLVSSLLFGLLHTEQGVVGVVLATVDGVLFSLLRLWSGTLWASILCHGFINTIGFVSFYLVGPVYGLW